jgi:ABC-type bacteriocin/lantibiotic exporter with double-glycine peptidase domain
VCTRNKYLVTSNQNEHKSKTTRHYRLRAACIASIASYHKLDMPVAKIRQVAGTDKKGTNVYGLLQAAEKLGFTAKGVKGAADALPKIPLPAIAHVVVKEVLQHYVVIYKVTEKYLEIMDPGTGKLEKMPMEKFTAMWTGVLVLMVPAEGFEKKTRRFPMPVVFGIY